MTAQTRSHPASRKLVIGGVLAAFGIAWALFLWPTTLGGETTYVVVQGTSMEPRLKTGDLVLTRQRESYSVGESVAFRVGGDLVIHRLHGRDHQGSFTSRGDNRDENDPWQVRQGDIVGQEWIAVPHAGWLMAALHNPVSIVLVFAALVVLDIKETPGRKERHDNPDPIAVV